MKNTKGTKIKISNIVLGGILAIAVFWANSISYVYSLETTEIEVPAGYKAEILATSDPGFRYNDVTFSLTDELIVSVSAQSRVSCDSHIASISPEGVVSRFADICIDAPIPVAFGPYTGSLLFFAETAGYWDYVYTVPAGGTPYDVQLFASGFVVPLDLAFSPDGDLYLADIYSGTIYRVNPEGEVSPFVSGFRADTSGYPFLYGLGFGIAFDSEGVLFVADGGAGIVYRVSADGVISPFASGFDSPVALAFAPNGDLFVADLVAGIIYSVSSDGVISPFTSGFKYPLSLSFDPNGDLYVLEWESIEWALWPSTRIIKISRCSAGVHSHIFAEYKKSTRHQKKEENMGSDF